SSRSRASGGARPPGPTPRGGGSEVAGPNGTADTTAVEIGTATARVVRPTGDDTGALPHHSFLSRLYTGTGAFEVIGRRTLWYGVSGSIVAIAILSILFRGFTFGIDFKGGTTVSLPVVGDKGHATVSQVEEVFRQALGHDPESVVIVGSGSS